MDTCICAAESLHCSPETVTTLFIRWAVACVGKNTVVSYEFKSNFNKPEGLGSQNSLRWLFSRFSHVWLFATPGFPVLHYFLEFVQTHEFELVMLSNHLILCHPLLLLPSVFPSIRVFSNESALCITWPKYWSFSFSISPSNEYSRVISFRIDWLNKNTKNQKSTRRWVGHFPFYYYFLLFVVMIPYTTTNAMPTHLSFLLRNDGKVSFFITVL